MNVVSGSLTAIFQNPDRHFAIGEIAVAAAVASVRGRANASCPIFPQQRAARLQPAHQPISLRIQIRRNMMRDRARVMAHANAVIELMAHANAVIECYRADPEFALIRRFLRREPKANMVSATRVAMNRLLERDVFDSPENIERTYRRVRIRFAKNRAPCDAETRTQLHRRGDLPARRLHGADHFFARADQCDV